MTLTVINRFKEKLSDGDPSGWVDEILFFLFGSLLWVS